MINNYQITSSLKYINTGYVCAVYRMWRGDSRPVMTNSIAIGIIYIILYYRAWINCTRPI